MVHNLPVLEQPRPTKRLRSHPPPSSIHSPDPHSNPPNSPTTTCTADPTGPRISQLFQLYTAKAHAGWVAGVANACIISGRNGFVCRHCAHRDDLHDSFELNHGAQTVLNYARFYLTVYVPNRFLGFSDSNWRQLIAALRAFHTWAVSQRFMREDLALEGGLVRLADFPMASLKQRLEQLGRREYWMELERRALQVGGEAVVHGEFDRLFGGCLNLIVERIEPDGWVFQCDPFDWVEKRNRGTVFVQIPPDVAVMGVVGMEFSCMTLGLRNRVWRPVMEPGEPFFTNVYPPKRIFDL